jgi:lauroyl/myristoyl acyltransferase
MAVEPKPIPGMVPTRVAVALAARRGRRRWRETAAREAARAAAEAVLGPGSDVDGVARAHLGETAAREELIRRPRANQHDAVRGLSHLRAARADGRGVLVSYCHVGPFAGFGATVARCTPDVHCIVGDWMFAVDPNPERQRRMLAWRSMFEAAGVPLIAASGSFHQAVELLRRGEVVMLAFDAPGPQRTEFLGGTVMLASGTARMVSATDALIVPAMRRLVRYRSRSVFAPALDSRDHDDWSSLHAAVAEVHGRSILSHPAALENPCRPGWWRPASEPNRAS